jgi:large subunit ribosomal protein L10
MAVAGTAAAAADLRAFVFFCLIAASVREVQMSKAVKQLMMDDLRQTIGDCREVIVVDASKLDGVTSNKWRLALAKKKIRAVGVKNALARKALGDVGLTGLGAALTGPSTLVFGGEDIVALSREIAEWAAKIKELQICGGAIGETSLTAADVESLSKSPGRRELLGQLAGQILGPGAQLAAAIQGPGGKLAGCLQALAEKEGAEAPAA